MPINFADVRTALYNWAVANAPGYPVIYLFNNSPRPTVDYLTLYIQSVVQIGWDWVENPTTTSGISNQVGDREFTLSVMAYGNDPLTVLNNLRTSLQKETVLDTLRANGIVYCNWFAVNDVTELIDSRYEQRGSLDLVFRIADVYTDTLGVIETVNVEEIINDPAGNVIYDQIFTIP